jgi:hypothetical protein
MTATTLMVCTLTASITSGENPRMDVMLRYNRGPSIIPRDVSLLKNLSDHRGCSSATATVGDARKFVRSRNPVTVIVKIESRNLDRAPYREPHEIRGMGGISPERRRDSTIAVCSGCATFVPMMESTDLGKCDDPASGRRLDRAGIRTVFI